LSEIALGIADSDSRHGEFPIEAEVVVFGKNVLYFCDGDEHYGWIIM
jgi:hypothetical protein